MPAGPCTPSPSSFTLVTVTGASSVNELGDGVQEPAGIALMHDTVTEPLNPPEGVNISGNVAGCPAATMAEVEPPGGVVMEISMPLPERGTDCGLAGGLSALVVPACPAPRSVVGEWPAASDEAVSAGAG